MVLSHIDDQGRAQMVDVSAKPDTERVAIAKGEVTMKASTLKLIRAGNIEKGDVFSVARVAGIMAAKRTHELIPMCHPLLITDVSVDFEILAEGDDRQPARVGITGTAKNVGKTGVEMEALVAVSLAGLTIYDMAKAVDRGMHVENVRLVSKRGGKSGEIKLE